MAEEGDAPELDSVRRSVLPRHHITSNIKVVHTEPTGSPFKKDVARTGFTDEYFKVGSESKRKP